MTIHTVGFFVACIVSALEFVHSKKIVHSQLKLSKLIFDGRGYLHLTDFSKAKYQYETPLADYYALGFIAQECFLGDAVSDAPVSNRHIERLSRVAGSRAVRTIQS